jgi:hypothetical protein
MEMPPEQIAASLTYFRWHGRYCDCEIMPSVEQSDAGTKADLFR